MISFRYHVPLPQPNSGFVLRKPCDVSDLQIPQGFSLKSLINYIAVDFLAVLINKKNQHNKSRVYY